MELADLLTVEEASERLHRSPQAVRLMAGSGELAAVKRGNEWWLDAGAVERRRREPPGRGRRLSPRTAWLVLVLASGSAELPGGIAAKSHHASRARRWLRGHPLVDHFTRLRSRAQREVFDAHPAEIARMRGRPDVMLTGISAADLIGVHGGDAAVEFYAPASARRTLIDQHALADARGPVLARWVSDDLWPAVAAPRAPRAAVLIDLLEHDDARIRREAARALERL